MALCATITPWDTRGQAIEDELGAVGEEVSRSRAVKLAKLKRNDHVKR